MMKIFDLLILSSLLLSCNDNYRLVAYNKVNVISFDTLTTRYEYVFERTDVPRFKRRLYAFDTCNCVSLNDTVSFERDSTGYLLIHNKSVKH